jgi:hypothetical protein
MIEVKALEGIKIYRGGSSMKKAIVFFLVLTLVAPALMAAQQPLVRLEVINQTGEDIYIQMEYPYTNLKVPFDPPNIPEIDPQHPERKPVEDDWVRTRFTITRDTYENVKIWACGGAFTGTLNLEHRLLLNFVPCEEMIQDWSPRWFGEPTMEKPNIVKGPNSDIGWRFVYKWQLTP